MRRISFLTTALMTAFLVSASAQAATTDGRVVAADTITNVFTIQTDDGRRFSFQKSDATTFGDYQGATVRLEDLKPGAKVTVSSDSVPSDPGMQLPATHVQVDEMVGEVPVSVAKTMDQELIETPVADRLPNTATPLPVVALAGVGSILAGIALCLRRR